MEKYVNNGEFEVTSIDADKIVAREQEEKSKEKRNGYDPEWEKHKNDIKVETKMRIAEVQQDAKDLYKMRYEAEQRKQQYVESQKQQQREQEKQKLDAIDLARERYMEKSGLYRFFHKRLSDKRASKMTTAEINNLYGGIEEEKGMSR